MIRRPPRSTLSSSSAASDVYKRQSELWDLLRILNSGVDFVLGREDVGRWGEWFRAIELVKGAESPEDEKDAWEWLRNPLPPGSESALIATLRLQLGIPDRVFFTDRGYGSL